MLIRSVIVCALLATISLAGCGKAPLPNQGGSVDDMRDAVAIAIEDGDEARVKQLIESQPLLLTEPIPNLNNATVVHCAARTGNVAILKYLLEQGADPYVQDDEGQYPYDVALAKNASEEVLDLLR